MPHCLETARGRGAWEVGEPKRGANSHQLHMKSSLRYIRQGCHHVPLCSNDLSGREEALCTSMDLVQCPAQSLCLQQRPRPETPGVILLSVMPW